MNYYTLLLDFCQLIFKKRNQLLFFMLLIPFLSIAWNDPSKNKANHNLRSKAAGCSPATGRKILEFNNVSALIETGGSMWLDRSRGKNAYEVPKGSGQTLIYIGGLWMGGLDVNNQLKLDALNTINFMLPLDKKLNCLMLGMSVLKIQIAM